MYGYLGTWVHVHMYGYWVHVHMYGYLDKYTCTYMYMYVWILGTCTCMYGYWVHVHESMDNWTLSICIHHKWVRAFGWIGI